MVLPKTRSYIKRRKPLNNRRKFHAFGDNPFKTYRRKYTDAQVTAWAQEKRRERLANPTEAEQAFGRLLLGIGCGFEREVIFLNGDRHVQIDFLIRKSIAIEIDGSVHDRQRHYDKGRDRWLLEVHGIRTIRFTNKEVLKTPDEVSKTIIMEIGRSN